MDVDLPRRLHSQVRALITIEENSKVGGFGEGVLDALNEMSLPAERIACLGLPDSFVSQGTRAELLEQVGLTPASLAGEALRLLGRS